MTGPSTEQFIAGTDYRTMPPLGFALIFVGVVVAVLGVIVAAGCTGETLLFFGAAAILIGGGISLSGAPPAVFFLGPIGVFLVAVGLLLAPSGHC